MLTLVDEKILCFSFTYKNNANLTHQVCISPFKWEYHVKFVHESYGSVDVVLATENVCNIVHFYLFNINRK